MNDVNLTLTRAIEADELAAALAAGQTAEPEGTVTFRRHCFDSFDWRLHRAGLVLVHEDDCWRLRGLMGDGIVAEASAAAETWPRFAGEFPAGGGLRKRLLKLLKMRAAIHLATVAGERRTWRVLNTDGKIVLRIDLATLRSERHASRPAVRVATLRPLRGYEGPAERVRAEAARLGLIPLDRPVLDAVLVSAGLEPEGYSPKFRVELAPAQTALEAAVHVSRSLLAAMRSNEAGVDKDIDTEFLHDLRVAVRRQRSALAIFAGVFAPDPIDGFRREFAALGRLTGPLRDLDVYLLDEDRFRGLVPGALQPGLDGLFDDLRAQRREALAQVRTALHAPAYRQLTTAWDTFLADPQPGSAAAQPVLDLARVHLRRRHDRVLRRGRAIRARTPASALHRLRIECKKLRYLLEFFAALFAAEDVDALVSRLKGLQDNLGEFNDLSVQQDRLRTTLAGLPPRRQSSLAEAAALGGLVAALYARQQEVRGKFAAAFDAFTGPEVAQRFASLVSDDQETRDDQEARA